MIFFPSSQPEARTEQIFLSMLVLLFFLSCSFAAVCGCCNVASPSRVSRDIVLPFSIPIHVYAKAIRRRLPSDHSHSFH